MKTIFVLVLAFTSTRAFAWEEEECVESVKKISISSYGASIVGYSRDSVYIDRNQELYEVGLDLAKDAIGKNLKFCQEYTKVKGDRGAPVVRIKRYSVEKNRRD